jgi:hypothetical protein
MVLNNVMTNEPNLGGYLNAKQAAAFLGGRSVRWLRSHLYEIPHYKLYDRLLFDPKELKAFVQKEAERVNPIDLDAIIASLGLPKRGKRGGPAK